MRQPILPPRTDHDLASVVCSGRDATYGAAFLNRNRGDHGACSVVFGEVVWSVLRPYSVVEYGSGTGYTLSALRQRGVDVLGMELSDAAKAFAREIDPPLEESILRTDFHSPSTTWPVRGVYDVAICIEVLEHVRPDASDAMIASMAEHAAVCIVSSPPPNPNRPNVNELHINERSTAYWVERFAAQGMVEDETLTAVFRRIMRALYDLGEFVVPAWFFADYFRVFVHKEPTS